MAVGFRAMNAVVSVLGGDRMKVEFGLGTACLQLTLFFLLVCCLPSQALLPLTAWSHAEF